MASEFIEFILEQMAGFGPVSARRMFGGHGFFRDGLMFAIVSDEVLYFKVDDVNRADFTGRGLEPFYYDKQGRAQVISYYQAPEEVFEDDSEMRRWAESGYGAALRAGTTKKKKSRARNPK